MSENQPSSPAAPSSSSSSSSREDKNAVFSPGGAKTDSPYLDKQQYTRQELDFEIPVGTAELPSAGAVYSRRHPLHGSETVDFKAMTTKEEDILMSPALIKKGTVINELIKSCLMDPNIDVSSLLSGDRNALMINIRALGYGQIYDPTYQCPACDFKNNMRIDLNTLKIKPLKLTPDAPGENLFSFKLPMTGKNVVFKFLTGKEEEDILALTEMRKKKGMLNVNSVSIRLMHCLHSVEGNEDRNFISRFVQYLPARDSLALREYIDENEPGIDMMVAFRCSSCDHFEEVSLPMGATFFWPNARR